MARRWEGWKDVHGKGKNKQPYAIAMTDDSPFALAGIYDVWRNVATGEKLTTFCIVTCEPNELMATIHDRMPVILDPSDYGRWLSLKPAPRDLMKPFPADKMTMWPIGRNVGSPKNNTPDLLDRSTCEWWRIMNGRERSPDYHGSPEPTRREFVAIVAVIVLLCVVAGHLAWG